MDEWDEKAGIGTCNTCDCIERRKKVADALREAYAKGQAAGQAEVQKANDLFCRLLFVPVGQKDFEWAEKIIREREAAALKRAQEGAMEG